MANYANLKAQIDANIFQNDQSAITGAIMNTQLKAMVDALGAGYQFMGVATPSTNPGTPDQKVFYIALQAGTYTNFGGTVLSNGQIGVFAFGTLWSYTVKTIVEIVNDLTTGGTDKALSAEQGKTLSADFADLAETIQQKSLAYGEKGKMFLNTTNKFQSSASDNCYIIPVNEGDEIFLLANTDSVYNYYALVTTYPVPGTTAAYMTGQSRSLYSKTSGTQITAPQDGYLFVVETHTTAVECCKKIAINGEDVLRYSLQQQIDDTNKEIEGVKDYIGEEPIVLSVGNLGNPTTKTSSSYDIKVNLAIGGTYVITFIAWPDLDFFDPAATRFAFRLESNSPESGWTPITTIMPTGKNAAVGKRAAFKVPDDSNGLRIAGRCVGGVIDIRPLEDKMSFGDIREMAEDYEVAAYPEDALVEAGSFLPGGDFYQGFYVSSFVVPIKAGDVVIMSPYSNFAGEYSLVKDYPVAGALSYMTGYSGRVSLTQDTTITSPENGYLILSRSISEQDYQNHNVPKLLQVNERIIFPTIAQRVRTLEESPSLNVDSELDETSDNPVENKALTPLIRANKMMSDAHFFDLESNWWIYDQILAERYGESEREAVDAFKAKFVARRSAGVFQIAVISDTHGSGAYSWRNILRQVGAVCHRSISVFNDIAGYCDAAFHGGDLSCDYGTSRIRDLQYMYEILRMFSFNKPFFITKGNHDENNNLYSEVSQQNLDWSNNTYYVRNFSAFTPVTEDTWDGSPLFEESREYVSDREFRNIAQHWLSPNTAIWGNGAYYYCDFPDLKIRIINGNSFPVNDAHVVSEGEEYLWLAQEALNFSDKDTPSDWKVIMLRHTQATGISDLANCINAFINGTTWTYGETTVDFGEINGGGMTFIAHVHGHEHGYVFSNGNGFFDIGEASSFVRIIDLGDASLYGISVLSIDTLNSRIYEDTISGHTWVYDYLTNKLVLTVGETFVAAESGLPRPVSAASSNPGVASCDGMVVTAVAPGNATITVSGGARNYSYELVVVSE